VNVLETCFEITLQPAGSRVVAAGTSDVQADKAITMAEINSFLIVFLPILVALNCADYLYLNITQFF
jgi:hypothetical protein